MFERIRARIRDIESAPARSLPNAAARIQAKLRADATTRRGNVPGFGDMGGPITATATATGVTVRGPDWVLEKAAELGQPAEWRGIVAEELAAEVRR